MRRWTLLIAGAALWLFLAAIPALADGGPHVAAANSGSSTLTADSCAGCHRAHTAQGAYLINAPTEEELCLTCHGAAGTGATTDVMTGVQYAVGTGATVRGTTQLGALRNGGFVEARIASNDPSRLAYLRSATAVSQRPKVGVTSAWPVSSSHLDLDGAGGVTATGIAWGNGALNSGAGPTLSLSCASCHNPHGNGQFRILNPIPSDGTGPLVEDTAANTVTDAALPPAGDARNYTVIQTPTTAGYTLLASQVAAYPATAGDYFHRGVPWDTRLNNDAPNGIPGGTGTSFDDQITQWCSACHTRYYSTDDGTNPSGDAIYKYQHNTQSNRACTTCHVSHGSNASMAADPVTGTTYAQNFPYPDDPSSPPAATTSASSRLLKIDRRGTCQACHDPTGTILPNTSSGPVPVPYTP